MSESFFGEPWPSGVCDNGIQVPTPAGRECVHCRIAIEEGDQGTYLLGSDEEGVAPVHRECSLRVVMGGIGHQLDHLHWCREVGDPDMGLSFRESAKQVWNYYQDYPR